MMTKQLNELVQPESIIETPVKAKVSRLDNDQISQRIIETNSDIKRYLNLAPRIKLTPSQPAAVSSYSKFIPLSAPASKA